MAGTTRTTHSPPGREAQTGGALGKALLATAASQELATAAMRLYELVTGTSARERSTLGYSVQGAPALFELGPDGKVTRARSAEEQTLEVSREAERTQWHAARILRAGKHEPRPFTPWTVRSHLRGDYSAAPESHRWASWVALDIDAHVRPGEAVEEARSRAVAMLGGVWRAFRFSSARQPVLLRSPRGGFHVWIPLTRGAGASNAEHTWPRDWVRSWIKFHLREAGIEERDGELEIYPSGRRLRLPCGVGTELLKPTRPDDASDLGLVPWEGTFSYRDEALGGWRRVRRVLPMARAFCDAFEARRMTLAELLDRTDAEWDRSWAFFGRRPGVLPDADAKKTGEGDGSSDTPIQQIADVPPPGGTGGRVVLRGSRRGRGKGRAPRGEDGLDPNISSPADPDPDQPDEPVSGLPRGAAFARKVTQLLSRGITEPHARYDAVKTLTFHWGARCGLSRSLVLEHLERWCMGLPHEGSATLRDGGPAAFLKVCLREARSYYDACHERWPFRGRGGVPSAVLTTIDHVVLAHVEPRARDEAAAILSWLAGNADARGWVDDPVELAHGLLRVLCGERRMASAGSQRRRATVAVEELVRLGVLTMHTDYAVGSHGRVFQCWYRFGSGELARPFDLAAEAELVVPDAPPQARDRKRGTVTSETRHRTLNGALAGCRVLAERVVPEGTLLVLGDGTRAAPRVVLQRRRDQLPSPELVDARGIRWWTAHYVERRFSPGEFRHGDPMVAIKAGRRCWPVYGWMRDSAYRTKNASPLPLPANVTPLVLVIPQGVVEVMPADLRVFLSRPWQAWEVGGAPPSAVALAA
jgi:hypothetical protein